jgi:hypothetical protein
MAGMAKSQLQRENCDDLSSTAAHVAWWLESANTCNPQLRSTQIEHGPTTPGGRRIQGGAGRATQCWRSRICKLAYISCAPLSFPSGHCEMKGCRMAAWSVLSRTRDFIASRTASANFDPRCVALPSSCNYCGLRYCSRLSVYFPIFGGSFHTEPELSILSLTRRH